MVLSNLPQKGDLNWDVSLNATLADLDARIVTPPLVGGSLTPTTDNAFTLGSETHRWSHLYVGPTSITLRDTTSPAVNKDVTLSISGGYLKVTGSDGILVGPMSFTPTGITSNVSGQAITLGSPSFPGAVVLSSTLVFPDSTIQTTAFNASSALTGPTGPTGPQGPTGLTGPAGPQGPVGTLALYSGSFEDTTTQVSGGITTANVVTLNTTSRSNGVSIVSGSRVTFANAGDYFVSIIGQFRFSGGASSYDATMWYTKNGSIVSAAATSITLTSAQGSESIATLTDIVSVAAGDYIQFYWYTSVAPSAGPNGIYLYTNAAGTNPVRPSSPSIKLNVFNVG